MTSSPEFEHLGAGSLLLLLFAIVFVFALMAGILWLGWWVTQRGGASSPYSGKPMQKGSELAYAAVREIVDFQDEIEDLDNPPIDLERAAICKETGRIFPNAVTPFGVVQLDWSFIQRRHPGQWVSWGSLTELQKGEVRRVHQSFEGFQTDVSSSVRAPKEIDAYHALVKPGPLYVDQTSKRLLGWKCIPGTSLEVMVVQRPLYEYEHDLERES